MAVTVSSVDIVVLYQRHSDSNEVVILVPYNSTPLQLGDTLRNLLPIDGFIESI